MNKHCIIFDFDGVIVESESKSFQLISEILASDYSITIPTSLAPSKIGVPTISFLEKNFSNALSQQEIANAYNKFKKLSSENIEKYLIPHTQVIEFIRRSGSLYDIGIASMNTKEFLISVVSHFGLTSMIKKIISREDVVSNKPDPEIYLDMLGALTCQPENAIVLEDSLPGIKAANRANIDCLGVLNAYNRNSDFSTVKVAGFVSVENFTEEIEQYLA